MTESMDASRKRRKVDTGISVGSLQTVINEYCLFRNSRDLWGAFSDMAKYQTDSGSAKPQGLAGIHDFYRMLFQAIPAGRLPGLRMELALASEDNRSKLNFTTKTQDVFTAKLCELMLTGV